MSAFIAVAVIAGIWAVPAGLTATGARARGQRLAVAVLVGLAFPVTWAVWYVRDAHVTTAPGPR